jgi:PAS domain S-box-containing protein
MARILIVDDEPSNRDLLMTLLGYHDHVVLQACDGTEGLALTIAERPDLIITDIVMPEMDGYLFARQVHADPSLAHVRMLFYTAADIGPEERKLAAAYGVTHILAKPAEPETILATVNAALDSAPPTARPTAGSELDRTYLRLLTNTLYEKVEALKIEVEAHAQAEGLVRRLNTELEQRVVELTDVNQQLQQEIAERQRAERFLDSVLQQLPSGVTIAEAPTGRLLMHNAEAVRLFGHPLLESADYTGYAQYGAQHPDGRAYAPEEYPIARALRTHEAVSHEELIYRRGDGAITTFLVNAAPIRNSEGRVVAAVSTFQDIADRKQMEIELANRQAQLASIIDSAMDAIIAVDEDQCVVIWNAAAERMFDCPVAAALGQPLDCFIPARYRDIHRTHIQAFGRTGSTTRAMGELRPLMGLRTTGEEFPIEASIAQVVLGERKLYTVIVRDITERMHAEAALHTSEERFATAFQSSPVAMVISTVADGRILDVNDSFLRLFGGTRTDVLGQSSVMLDMWANPDDRARAVALLGQHGAVRDLDVTIRARGGVMRDVLLSADRLQLGGEPYLITSIYDISERKQADLALRAALTAELTARQTAEILQAASQALASTLDQGMIFTTLLEHLAHLVPYDSANVMVLTPGGQLALRMHRGYERWTDSTQIDGRELDPTLFPLLQELITSRQSVLASDTRHDPRWKITSTGNRILSWFGMPLLAGGELIGLYSASKTVAGFFTEDHVRRAEALAAPTAIAMQNARLFEAVRQAHARLQVLSQRLVTIQEAERRHIARELHDEVGQQLTGLRLTLELIARLPPNDQATRLSEAHAALQDLIGRVRSLSLDLRPAMLDDLGLLSALLWHFRRYTEQTGIAVECKHRNVDQRFSAVVETVAYRVVQETLTNVARHAGVTTVDVWLLATPEQLSVRISDAGRGFDPAAAMQAPRSSGLLGMQERVTLLGGSLSITSALGNGTQVLADLPLNVGIEEQSHDDYDRPRG